MLVKDVMNKNVIAADPKTSVREIAKIMADNRIGSVIIKSHEKMVGIVTDHDVLSAFARNRGDPDKLPVEEIMTRYVLHTSPESPVERAVGMMEDNKIKKLPVMKDEKVVGIITASDVMASAPGMIKRMKNIISHTT